MFHVKHSMDDTIAAIATPIGVGGVGIIRISGNNALKILKKHFLSTNGKVIDSHKMLHGWLIDPSSREKLDQILACYMKGPKSFTGDDVVELYCHGGVALLEKSLNLLINSGARLASRGEFSKRAFLNGKLDLIKAEAVLDLVNASTARGSGHAVRQLEGKLSTVIFEIREELLDILSNIEAMIDFPDDVPEFDPHETRERLQKLVNKVNNLQSSARLGKIFRHGLCTAIVGRPNVGKSSLLNRILGENRAIVTEYPGTTRDVIEEVADVNGLPVRLIDTAGICESADNVEQIGVKRAKNELESADLALLVLDASKKLTEQDLALLASLQARQFFVVLNKVDLGIAVDKSEIMAASKGVQVFEVSALTCLGIEGLLSGVYDFATKSVKLTGKDAVLINSRHNECLNRVKRALANAIDTCFNGFSADLVAIDVKGAILALGEISGEEVSDEVINQIFDQFCVGK